MNLIKLTNRLAGIIRKKSAVRNGDLMFGIWGSCKIMVRFRYFLPHLKAIYGNFYFGTFIYKPWNRYLNFRPFSNFLTFQFF